jgi:insulysin
MTDHRLFCPAVHHDAAHIKALTKADMIEFYNYFVLPASPARSKLAIHLNAQTPKEGPKGVTAAVEKGMKVLGLNKDKKDEEDGEVVPVKEEGNGTIPYIITDVREFKSKMQVSAGPQPVKHISEFEELDSKL